MKNSKRFLQVLFGILIGAQPLTAQDFTFSQFYDVPLLRNPAIAGIFKGDLRVNGAYRSQWSSVTTPYVTQALSVETRIPVGFNNFITPSLLVTRDAAGDSRLSRLNLMAGANYMMNFSDETGYFSLGFLGGLIQSRFDPTRLTFDDQFQGGRFDPNNVSNQYFTKTSESHFDMATGVSYSDAIANGTILFYVGGAYYHLNKPKVSFMDDMIRLKPRVVANAGLKIYTGERDELTFYGDMNFQGGHRQGLIGVLFSHTIGYYGDDDGFHKTIFTAGSAIRWGDAVMPIIRLERKNLGIGLSYDVNISKLTRASMTRGGFELTLSYRTKLNIWDSAITPCPF
jgi:type IX secretion system PorP/SprF family membrane protein